MTKQPLSVTEMFSSIMELLEQAGYAKHTLWGNMYGPIRGVVNFYHEKGICNYDPAVTHEFIRPSSSAIGREKSAGNTTMPKSVLPENLKCPTQQEPSHGSVQKGHPSTSSTGGTAAC